MDSKNFDLTVVQKGDIYVVSGDGAVALYHKLQMIPHGARTLAIGPLKNGTFTLRKIGMQQTLASA